LKISVEGLTGWHTSVILTLGRKLVLCQDQVQAGQGRGLDARVTEDPYLIRWRVLRQEQSTGFCGPLHPFTLYLALGPETDL
jgi:hypothetical protein